MRRRWRDILAGLASSGVREGATIFDVIASHRSCQTRIDTHVQDYASGPCAEVLQLHFQTHLSQGS